METVWRAPIGREVTLNPEGGTVLADIEIAQQATLKRINELAAERLGIPEDQIEPYGHYKAKLSSEYLASLSDKPEGKLVLVTAISPTPAGEGKTTTTVGLGDALNRIGKNAVATITASRFSFTGTGGGKANTCHGDSGGPA